MNVDESQYFRVSNGTIIRDLKELDYALEHMGDETFYSHVNEHKNDFSNWIRHSMGDERLADDIASTNDRRAMQLSILRRILDFAKI